MKSGGLKEEYTFDGVHLKAQYIEIWKDFLKTACNFIKKLDVSAEISIMVYECVHVLSPAL